MLIGITGQIGSGKSEVARIFGKYGAFVISADKIGKDVVEKNPAVLNKLVRAFGTDILTRSGRLRRKMLAELAFSSEELKQKLNNIVHPPLLKELAGQGESALRTHKLVVIDAALLLDWGWDKKVDMTIFVHANDRMKIARLVENGYTIEEAKMRLKSQPRFAEFKERSDITILNNKSLDSLEVKVKKIIRKFS